MYEAIVFLPLLGAFIAGIFGPIIGARASTYVTSGFMVLVAILSAIAFANVAIYEGPKTITILEWIHSGNFEADWKLRIDTLTAVMLVVVNGVSCLVHIYSIGYMSHDPHQSRFFAYLSLFTFFDATGIFGSKSTDARSSNCVEQLAKSKTNRG